MPCKERPNIKFVAKLLDSDSEHDRALACRVLAVMGAKRYKHNISRLAHRDPFYVIRGLVKVYPVRDDWGEALARFRRHH